MKRTMMIGPPADEAVCWVGELGGMHRWSPEWVECPVGESEQAGCFADYTQYCLWTDWKEDK